MYINGEDKTRDSISNTNSYIASLFDCTPEVFQNCVIMTLNNTIPFMAKKKQDKRKFIEDIFNLSIFSNMVTSVKEDANNNKKMFDIQAAKLEENNKNLESQKKQHALFVEERKKKFEKYTSRKENNANELELLNKKINDYKPLDLKLINDDIDKLNKKADEIDKKIKKIRDNNSSLRTQIDLKTKSLKQIGTDKDVCPTCLRKLDDKDKDHIKDEKKKIKSEIEAFEKDILSNVKEEETLSELDNKITKGIETCKARINNHNLEEQNIANIKNRINQLNLWQKELDQDLKDLENNQTVIDNSVTDIEEKINIISKEIEVLKSKLKHLDIVKFILSEEGVKSFIVKKILQLFNTKLAYYLKKMDANCICSFNEYFEEKIIDDKGKDCSYFNFSGAERKNIDLACLFAFMDIRRLQGNVSFNFSIYDELFDSSLDEKGVELVIGILKERVEKYKECAMVISHRKESIKSATGDIIFLEKSNGITKKVDYIEYKP